MPTAPCTTISKAGGSVAEDAVFRSSVLLQLTKLAEQQVALHRLAEQHRAEVLKELAEQRRFLMPDPDQENNAKAKCDLWCGPEPVYEAMDYPGPEPVNEAIDFPHASGVADSTYISKAEARAKKKAKTKPLGALDHGPNDKGSASCVELDVRQLSGRARVEHFLRGPYFDVVMGVVIMVNMLLLFAELQVRGCTKTKYDLGLASDPRYWPEAEDFFNKGEYCFTFVYIIELLIRIGVFGRSYFYDSINVIDTVIVLFGAIKVFILEPLNPGGNAGANLVFARLVKLARIVRMVKMIKFMNKFQDLRILLKTLAVSTWSLIWSMSLVALIVITSGILMFQLGVEIMEDESQDLEMRQWLYTNFGTAAQASYTMFVCTFTAAWVGKADYLIREVGNVYAIFWLLYIILVNFAVMRVVGALFLKQTMQVAAVDGERIMMEKMSHQKRNMRRLKSIFDKADCSGDGVISTEEFDRMIEDPDIIDMFEKMEIEVPEIQMLFGVLSEDDGETDFEEFIEGATKMKNSARCIDTIQIQHMLGIIKRTVLSTHSAQTDFERRLNAIGGRLGRLEQFHTRLAVPNGSRWRLKQ